MKKLNNKGFTLVELLTVLVILITILMIAIPSITASMKRSENKQQQAEKNALVSNAMMKLNKGHFTSSTSGEYQKFKDGLCYVTVDALITKSIITKEEATNSKDKQITGKICYKNGDAVLADDCGGSECILK